MPSLVTQLAAALGTENVEQVSQLREQLNERLASSRANDFSDAQRIALEELGVWDLVGNTLRDRIEEIFLRNGITMSTAEAEISKINERLQNLVATLDHLIAGFNGFGIGAEELAPGDFEVGFLIPREAVGNVLERLGKEFEELDKLLGPFMELTGESRPDLEVRSISSSGFQVFLAAFPDLALTMSKIVESLLSSYEKIRNIRAKVGSLEDDDDVPPEAIEGLRNHANERMEIDIDALANELVGQAAAHLPEGRSFELTIDVKRSIRKLAKRIDEGYSIEVRAFVPPEGEGDEPPEGLSQDAINAARAIAERQPRMRRMNLTGRPILELPEGDEEAEAEGGTSPEGDPE